LDLASPVVLLAMGGGGVALGTGLVWWFFLRSRARDRRHRAEAARLVARGQGVAALPYLIEQADWIEAARIEEARGRVDRAAELYERADALEEAAQVYARAQDHDMAALLFKHAEKVAEAAQAFRAAGRFENASQILEEAGDLEGAAALLVEAGLGERAAELLRRLGHQAKAAELLAESAEKAGRTGEAAEHWVAAGHPDKALALYRELGCFAEAAALIATERPQEAAELLWNAGDFLEAARLFSKAGDLSRAAHAYYRGGDLQQTVQLLQQTGEWLTLARVYEHHGDRAAAKRALMRVDPEAPRFVDARQRVAELDQVMGDPEGACEAYRSLVKYAEEKGQLDDRVRSWVLKLAELQVEMGNPEGALGWLERLEELGLMTPEIKGRIRALKAAPNLGVHQQSYQILLPRHERYEFQKKLAQGGNGVIYKACDKALGRDLVIKMIGASALPSDVARSLFLREAQLAAKLNHPNIVTIYDIGEIAGQPYIAMELVDGDNLADLVENGELPMAPQEVVRIMKQLCTALQYAHDRGTVHRDIKLENVMLTQGIREVKLMDFGLATMMDRAEDALMVSGTPVYMAPEAIVGQDVDHRTDTYSLGVMLYLLVVGNWPFDPDNVLEHHRFSPVPDPRQVNPELPEAFTAIIRKCMAKSRHDRYERVEQVAIDLAQAFPL
jgi:tRNA A-37 threonylcarbamoyl transferase component Bud32